MSNYYHLSVKIISRSTGRSAVACAAYRSGQHLFDERYGVSYDFGRKSGIKQCGIIAPFGAPNWTVDREQLWNHVELFEKRKDAQLAREFVLGLPHQLSSDQQRELLDLFIRTELTSRGLVADWAIHAPNRQGDERNWHAHVMTSLRSIEGEEFRVKKDRELNSRKQLQTWRARWAELQNDFFQMYDVRNVNGTLLTVDHRSFEKRGVDFEPTIHLGVHASAMERRGIRTERGDINREINLQNFRRYIGGDRRTPQVRLNQVQDP